MFFLKYCFSFIIPDTLRMSARPGIFTENNFELIFLCGIYFILFRNFNHNQRFLFGILVFLILIIGASRSALVAYMLAFFAYVIIWNPRYFLVTAPLLPLAIALTYFVFDSRGALDLRYSDRFNFFNHFMFEMENASLTNWLFGRFGLQAIEPSICNSLSYYKALFSRSGDGTCYSVILHSLFMRVIIDHGLIILLSYVGAILYGFRVRKWQTAPAFALIILISVSGLSVSSFNSTMSGLLLLIAASTRNSPDARSSAYESRLDPTAVR